MSTMTVPLGKSLKISPVNYPRRLDDNIRYRIELTKACLADPELAADVVQLCRHNPVFWVDTFCYTKDPRKDPDVLPFICYEAFQIEDILEIKRAIREQYDLLLEKSRDMGVSWMVLYVFLHEWLFESGADFRVGSRKEEFVDKPGDIDTLFEKLRFNLKLQPRFLMPRGFRWDEHATYMRLINPESGNSIIGESANNDFASGGRRRAVLLDEFSKWDPSIATAAWTSTADVTKCRIPVATPLGSGNKFASLAKGIKEKIKKLTLHWTLHPEKNRGAYVLEKDGTRSPIDLEDLRSAYRAWLDHRGESAPAPLRGGVVRSSWYDDECERRDGPDIAQELDIDYLKSGSPYFDLVSIAGQKRWNTYVSRETPTVKIPHGCFVLGNLVKVEHKVEFRETPSGWLKVFELPHYGGQYVIGGDVGEGLPKGDECFGVIMDRSTLNVVATYRGAIDPDEMAIRTQKAGAFFNNALLAPENNNHGYSVCSDLKQMDCNLYYTKRTNVETGDTSVIKAGWSTTPVTRPLMLDQAKEYFRKDSGEVRDEIILSQCETFVRNAKSGKPEADGDFLDDGVLAFAIALQVCLELPSVREPARQSAVVLPVRQPANANFSFKRKA